MKYDLIPYQITSGMVNTLVAIAESIGHLEGVNLIQPGPQLRRKNRIQTIQASLAIEGNSLTRYQAIALLDKNRIFGPPRDILEVQNAITAYRRIAEFT
jgi:Fic family protein